jgi:ComF family protein
LNVLTGIEDILFPPRCAVCGELMEHDYSAPLCLNCMKGIRFIVSPLCLCCGIPFPAEQENDHLCSQCLADRKPYAVARSVATYEGTILTAIHMFKYHKKTGIGKALGNIMADFVSGIWDMNAFDLIIPVPLHIKRLRERGFNQSAILARVLSRRFKIALDVSSLRRTLFTPPQVGLGRKERSVNVKGAFSVTSQDTISGKRILLIDDVYTTGSTLLECSRVLLEAKAEAVAVLTMARAVGENDAKEGER